MSHRFDDECNIEGGITFLKKNSKIEVNDIV